jgi:hypothetical protein
VTTSPTCIIAYVGEEGRYNYVKEAASRMASTATARLILYYSGAGGSQVGEKLGADHPGYLEMEDLREAGYDHIAADLAPLQESGIQVFAWVPTSDDPGELAEYARRNGADLVMLPAEKGDQGFVERLFRDSFEEQLEEEGQQVALVGVDGNIDYPQHEDAHSKGAESVKQAKKDAQL